MREYKETDPVFYFAYGSNMNAERVGERGADFTERHKHTLPGYGLRFNKISSQRRGTGCTSIEAEERGQTE